MGTARQIRGGWGRRVLFALAALLLTLVLLVSFAWLLFPRDFARQLPGKALAGVWPQWQWRVEAVHFELPLALRLEGIEATPRATPAAAPVQVERLVLRPDLLASFRQRQWQGGFQAQLAGGTITGEGTIQAAAGQYHIRATATAAAIDLAALGWLRQLLDRQLRGLLSGTVQARLVLPAGMVEELQARFHAVDGEIPLRRPILGHRLLPFSELSFDLEQEEGQRLALQQGSLHSPLGESRFRGQVHLSQPLAASPFELRALVQARPELYRHVRPSEAAAADSGGQSLPQRLHVLLSGTLADPAFAFERGGTLFDIPDPAQRPAP